MIMVIPDIFIVWIVSKALILSVAYWKANSHLRKERNEYNAFKKTQTI